MNYYVYLSSTDYYDEPGCNWKRDFISEFNKREDFKKDNVMTFIDQIQYSSMNPCVVGMDVQNMNLSEIIVFYIEKLSIGTIMELAYCTLDKMSSKRLYLISNNSDIINHPWIRNLTEDHTYTTPFSRVTLCTSPKAAVEKIVQDLMPSYGEPATETDSTNN